MKMYLVILYLVKEDSRTMTGKVQAKKKYILKTVCFVNEKRAKQLYLHSTHLVLIIFLY